VTPSSMPGIAHARSGTTVTRLPAVHVTTIVRGMASACSTGKGGDAAAIDSGLPSKAARKLAALSGDRSVLPPSFMRDAAANASAASGAEVTGASSFDHQHADPHTGGAGEGSTDVLKESVTGHAAVLQRAAQLVTSLVEKTVSTSILHVGVHSVQEEEEATPAGEIMKETAGSSSSDGSRAPRRDFPYFLGASTLFDLTGITDNAQVGM